MLKRAKNVGLVGVMAVAMIFAQGGASAHAAGSCTATNEEELYVALEDASCGGIITLNKSGIQDKGIQLTKDFDGKGATLVVGTSSYGLLIDDHGLDGHAGVVAGSSIVIKNVTIKADSDSKALINIEDIPTTLENVTTDRTASTNYYSHIDVKDTTSLTFTNYDANGGYIAIDYSPNTADILALNMDAASIAAVADIPDFISAYGAATITAGNPATLDFLTSDTTVLYKDDIKLDASSKQNLISTTPYISTPAETEDGRDVVVVADGADDTRVASIAEQNDDFADFVSQLDDAAVFIALEDHGDCDGAGCATVVTVSNLEVSTKYYLYHYDDGGNVELVGEFVSDENGSVDVEIEKFSGNVLSKVAVNLSSSGQGTGLSAPMSGVMDGFGAIGAKVSASPWLLMAFGLSVAVLALGLRKLVRMRR